MSLDEILASMGKPDKKGVVQSDWLNVYIDSGFYIDYVLRKKKKDSPDGIKTLILEFKPNGKLENHFSFDDADYH